jgi:hypothetical protein
MKALIYKGEIIQVQQTTFDVHPDYEWHDCPDETNRDWSYVDGVFTPPAPIVLTAEEKLRLYQTAVSDFVNSVARQRQYDNALSAASYANSTNVLWKAEAEVFIAWRDVVYADALQVLADVNSGEDAPSIDDLLASFPAIQWPN